MIKGEEHNVVSIRKMRDKKIASRKSIKIYNAIPNKAIKAMGKNISNKDEKKRG